jgi:hypothetical protein
VPGLGRCASIEAISLTQELLKAWCESPEELPVLNPVRLMDESGRKEWKRRLGEGYTYFRLPTVTWLSPLNRQTAFFLVTDMLQDAPGSAWLVPRDSLSKARIAVAANEVIGRATVSYELTDLDLRNFVVKPR